MHSYKEFWELKWLSVGNLKKCSTSSLAFEENLLGIIITKSQVDLASRKSTVVAYLKVHSTKTKWKSTLFTDALRPGILYSAQKQRLTQKISRQSLLSGKKCWLHSPYLQGKGTPPLSLLVESQFFSWWHHNSVRDVKHIGTSLYY